MKRLFTTRSISRVLIATLVLALVPSFASASQITSRKLTLGSSAASASTTYSFNFTLPSATALNGYSAQICLAASGACSTPTGWANTGATLTAPTGLPGTWVVDNGTAGQLRAKTSSNNAVAPSSPITITFNSVTNPNTANQTFYARLTTYSDSTYATPVDTGTVAASTSSQITITGTMDESLVFCAGTSITGQNCGTIAGTAVNLGTFSTVAAVHSTSVVAASTNAASGYAITVNGSVPTCSTCSGSPSIAAMGTQSTNGAATTSSAGVAQFGLNLRANTSLGGADVSGTGSGTYGTNYGTVDNFRFFTGDTIASAAAATNANAFTVNYIVNVPGSQPAGTYATTLTYICTATF